MDDSQRKKAFFLLAPKIYNFYPQAAPQTMPQNHKPGFDPEKRSLPPLSLQWVSPGYHHSWQLLIQPTVEDGWGWRLLHGVSQCPPKLYYWKVLPRIWTRAFQLQIHLQYFPLSCPWARKSKQFLLLWKVHFMFLKTIVLLLLHVLLLQPKKPSFFSLSLQAVLYGPATILAVVLWLYSVGLCLTYLWLVNMLSPPSSRTPASRTIWSRPKDAERILQ